MTTKAKAAIIGPGNIGTDLLMKCQRSEFIEAHWMVGIEESAGIQRAREFGLRTSTDGVDGLVAGFDESPVDFVFDATSAYVHAENSRKVTALGATMIDLTPAAIGPFCIPPVNLETLLDTGPAQNVNMVTCGGKATIPMVYAVSRVQNVKYAEIVATVASKSVGMGTRDNIDEFTRTTSSAIAKIGGADEGKAIIIINPAEPPLVMKTLFTVSPVMSLMRQRSAHQLMPWSLKYKDVPGYKLNNAPIIDGNRVTISVEVED